MADSTAARITKMNIQVFIANCLNIKYNNSMHNVVTKKFFRFNRSHENPIKKFKIEKSNQIHQFGFSRKNMFR